MSDPIHVLQRLGQSQALEDFADAIARISEAVVATGNPGSVSLTIKLAKGPGDNVVVAGETIKENPPSKPSRGAMFYVHGGALHDRDPRQPEMPYFRAVDVTSGEIVAESIPTAQAPVQEVS